MCKDSTLNLFSLFTTFFNSEIKSTRLKRILTSLLDSKETNDSIKEVFKVNKHAERDMAFESKLNETNYTHLNESEANDSKDDLKEITSILRDLNGLQEMQVKASILNGGLHSSSPVKSEFCQRIISAISARGLGFVLPIFIGKILYRYDFILYSSMIFFAREVHVRLLG